VSGGRYLGLGHESHPLLGTLVVDTASGRVGILRAIVQDDPRRRAGLRRAWLRPEGGGVEWTTDPDAVKAV
jgi:hypothetical protein